METMFHEMAAVGAIAMCLGVAVFSLQRFYFMLRDAGNGTAGAEYEEALHVLESKIAARRSELLPDQSTLPDAIRVQFFQEMFEGIDAAAPLPEVDQLPDLPPLGYGVRDV